MTIKCSWVRLIRLSAVLFFSAGLLGCSSLEGDGGVVDPQDQLSQLKGMRSDDAPQEISGAGGARTIREVALYETALSLGMRGGLAYRSEQINHELDTRGGALYQMFDFSSLLLKNQVLPPVLIEARDTVDAESVSMPTTLDPTDALLLINNPSGQELATVGARVNRSTENIRTLRITDRIFRIVKQARFALTIPTWRDYLVMAYVKPASPQVALLPKDSSEAAVWENAIEKGWEQGMGQADHIFEQNLALLKRDYIGMVRYRSLLSRNMVSAPFVAERHYGTTGGGDEMKVRDRVLTIAALPALKADARLWEAKLLELKENELDKQVGALLGPDLVNPQDDLLAQSFKVARSARKAKKSPSFEMAQTSGSAASAASAGSVGSTGSAGSARSAEAAPSKQKGIPKVYLSDKPGDQQMLLSPWALEK
jgi:defect-in-organelle-trafficking protein DotC